MFGLPIATCLLRIFCLLICFRFDTPTFYILKNKKSKAMKVLKKIYKENYIKDQYKKLMKDCSGD